MDRRWAQAPLEREQHLLFGQTLDEAVAHGHPIRVLDSLLLQLDWQDWEAHYAGRRGQPPIHPRYVAGAILYGVMRGVRSSRELEDATRERIDFKWFLQGQTIDHSTFAEFRVKFGKPIKQLSRQIARLVCSRFEESLLTLVLDGTRIRANSDRHGARTEQGLERLIAACAKELDAKLERLGQADNHDTAALRQIEELNARIAALEAQIARYLRALAVAKVRGAAKRKKKGTRAAPVAVPVADPDATLAPNKEGGFAPNYTPTIMVDAASRAIVSQHVQEGSDEAGALLPALAEARSLGANAPQSVLADTAFASDNNLRELEERGIDACMPTGTDFGATNPANRPDPTQPVPAELRGNLPLRDKRLSHSAFVYDHTRDCYHCPMGKTLALAKRDRRGGRTRCQYACPGKGGCPMADRCARKKDDARTVVRHPGQDLRDRIGRRMATPQGEAQYAKRAPVVEGVFAHIKHLMGIRRFLLRGLDKVRTEWDWICTAYNLKRLLRLGINSAPKGLKAATC